MKRMKRIAFQGLAGAYSELALYRHFGKKVHALGCEDFAAVFEAVVDGSADAGFIPVENTIAGTVVENYDMLLVHPVTITAEVFMPIRHCLLAPRGATLQQIKTACSHPHALLQCKAFLREHAISPQPVYDTAGAASMIAASGCHECAAIASELCAEIYGLQVLHVFFR